MDKKEQESLLRSTRQLVDLMDKMLGQIHKMQNRLSILELLWSEVIGVDINEIHKKMEDKGIKIT